MSVVFASGVTNVRRRGAKKETPEEDALNGMWRMADFMRAPNLAALAGWEKGTPGVMMIAPDRRAADGRSRLDPAVDTRIPVGELEDPDGADARAGAPAWIEIDANPVTRDEHQPRPVADLP